ncbi:hypothetical protein [Macrococcus bovicus]|uniref:hypothetical protein n=1 Tax=Macrococcus bovicus TaxID=69968 RepID=UPI0025A5B1E3|nr:hypothetical protein [Macrococcus bovicus]WJP97108.1 hypothetical protein QSV55_07425 [Macrococcus bovicus]
MNSNNLNESGNSLLKIGCGITTVVVLSPILIPLAIVASPILVPGYLYIRYKGRQEGLRQLEEMKERGEI